uniref:Uncharacterized protein n=1 Tax=Anguilla anguilla TaxID=7936 RepID=A0A0E9RVN7_ANGAN
MERISEKIY